MDWRESFVRIFGPGMLGGITFGQWLRLLWRERFSIGLKQVPRALCITALSVMSSAGRGLEELRYGAQIREARVEPPIFVLGHWRSGTTHLHQLLAQDRRLAFPNGYEAAFPHTFLTTERVIARLLSSFLPKHRPMDNVEWTLFSPQEDEFALCALCLESPCLGWAFPRNRKKFGRFLTFREASPAEIERWRAALEWFVKKLSWKYRRRLVLKSPPHTCRIRLLLEVFPEAKFVHIHRHPYAVFQSTRNLLLKMFGWLGLQRPLLDELDDWILEQYREMYEVFFAERKLIPPGSYHELAFEDLERDPVGEVRKIYGALGLPDFHETAEDLRRYVDSLRGYQKNLFPMLSEQTAQRIQARWQASFAEWGYEDRGRRAPEAQPPLG